MTITIYGSDYDALWQETNPASQNIKSERFSETLQLVPKRLGQGYIQLIRLYGIELTLFNYQLHEDLFLIRKDVDTTDTHREFGFHLSGHRHGKRTGENFVQWGSFDEPDEYVEITYAGNPILKVDVHVESVNNLVQSIAEILEELPRKTRQRISNNSNLSEIGHITPAMRAALRQIFNCPFQGKTKQIYLESKCLELITLKLEQLKQRDKPTEKLYSLKWDCKIFCVRSKYL